MHPRANNIVILLGKNLAYWSRSEIVYGANIAARKIGYRLTCLDWYGSKQCENEYLSRIILERPSGVIFIAPLETKNLPLCQKIAASIPTVLLLNYPEIPSDRVDVDHYAGASIAMEHLIGLGYRQIGHITLLLDLPAVRERLKAYLDAIKRAGFPFLDEWLLRLPGYLERRDSVHRQPLLRKFLQNPSRPKAVFAYADWLAMELIQVAWELGLSVPQDFAVVGFDDMPPIRINLRNANGKTPMV